MSSLARGVRNAFRKPTRLVAVVALVGLALGLALTMAAARTTLDQRADLVRSTVGTTLTVQSAQTGGFGGGGGGFFAAGGDSLAQGNLTFIESEPHVAWVRYDLVSFTSSSNTTLKGVGFGGGGGGFVTRGGGGRGGFGGTPPVPTFGTTRFDTLPLGGGGNLTLSAGTTPEQAPQPAALLGQALAEANNLTVGMTFMLHNTSVTVSGIYSADSNFATRAVVLPLATLQQLTGQGGEVTSATVRVDRIDNVDAVQKEVQAQLGDQADVTSGEQFASTATASLASIGDVASTSLWACAVAAAAIVVLVMVLVARERRREIGTLKAIGAPTSRIVLQFAAESVAFTAMALLAALAFAWLLRGTVARWLDSQASTGGGPGGGGARFVFGGNALAGLHVSPLLVAIGAAAALLLGVVGSVGPALMVAWTRPANVLRGA